MTPEDREAVLDQTDIDRELAVPGDELLGAVERVDGQKRAAQGGTPSASTSSSETTGMSGKACAAIAR